MPENKTTIKIEADSLETFTVGEKTQYFLKLEITKEKYEEIKKALEEKK